MDMMVRMPDARGYVTKDFPFLDESNRKVMESILDETENYWDFTEKLAAKVVDSQTHPNLVYLTLYHVSRNGIKEILNQILDAHNKLPIPFPVYYPSGNDYYNDKPIIERAIELNNNPVITFYMLMRLFRTSDIGSPEEEQASQLVENLLIENPQLKLHSADYIGITGHRRRLTGQPQESFDMISEALQLARESGDKWHQASLLTLLGELAGQFKTGLTTFSDAKKYLSEAVDLCREIKNVKGLANALNSMGVFASSRGEYGEAYDCHLESAQMCSEIGDIPFTIAFNIAGVCLITGDDLAANEWLQTVRIAENSIGPYAHFGDILIHIRSGKVKEAERLFAAAKELTLSLGLETALGQLYRVEGALLRAQGDLESAMDSVQKALDINERANRHLRVRLSLRDLVEMELDMFTPTTSNRGDEYSGPWMERLAKEVENNDIPGFYGRFLAFQSELRMLQGRYDEAEDILDSVIEMSDNNAMRFLHRDAIARKQKWVKEGILPLDTFTSHRRKR